MHSTRSLVVLPAVLVVLIAGAPAAGALELPPAPIGGTSGLDCVPVCIIDQTGGSCNSSANVGGVFESITASIPFSASGFRRGSADGSCAAATPVDLPTNLAPGQVVFFNLDFSPTVPGIHDGTLFFEAQRGSTPISDQEPLTATATGGDATAPCVPDATTLCLVGDRFKVQTTWATDQGTSGVGNVVPFQTDDSGLFWFFTENNWEVVVKVLDACPVNERFWVFAGGLTNVATVITVTDTEEGRVKTYSNPQTTAFQPIQDTNAFATCP